jgi:bifunctional UDP-N-acetylglucosamine pyrophosphorylase/glucosamine-1-phosphate N-acetyltransferase
MSNQTIPLILAAGKGTRTKSDQPKVLHPLLGKPMLTYILNTLKTLGLFSKIGIIIGYAHQQVQQAIAAEPGITFILQLEQMGTGQALMCARTFWEDTKNVLVLNGDVPLIRPQTIKGLMDLHQKEEADLSFVTTYIKGKTQYGVIIRDEKGEVRGIKEFTERKKNYAKSEINAGIYNFKTEFLKESLGLLKPNQKKGEYYITDLISLAATNHKKICTKVANLEEVQGVNNKWELGLVTNVLQKKILKTHMVNGVTIIAPENTYIESDVEIGADTTIEPGVYLKGSTKIGNNCFIGVGTVIKDSIIASQVEIKPYCVVTQSQIETKATIGPFAHLRPKTHIGPSARIGNFVEIKKSYVGAGTKASHLSYLGDAEIGVNVNIGAGTITCNYDGEKKHKTVVKDGVFIGSNTALIAPLTIGKDALIGAGSVITKDVPTDTLAIARARQVHKRKKKK